MDIHKLSFTHPIIIFDGYCNLCNGFIQFILKRDSKRIFRFATLNSALGKEFEDTLEGKKDTVYLYSNGQTYFYSDVALRCVSILGGIWSVFSIFSLVPRFIRDRVYIFVARNRYRWFGKKETCMIPTSEMKDQFL